MAGKRVAGWLMALAGAILAPTGAGATTRAELEADVIKWAGTGPRAVFVAVDFHDSDSARAEFVFGVRFGDDSSTTISGLQALQALADGTTLEFTDAGGGFITRIAYTHKGRTYEGGGDYPPWWSYWESSDFATTYVASPTGSAGHAMRDGDTAGWLNTRVLWPDMPSPPNGPRVTPRSSLREDAIAWAGSGPREAFVVVDFDDSTTQSAEFAFGARFGEDSSTTITGLQALELLKDETALDFVDAGGGYITSIAYTHKGRRFEKGGDYPPWWSYWESANCGMSYVMSTTGAAEHQMSDGSAGGWLNTRVLWPAIPPSPNGPRVTPRSSIEEDVIEWAGSGPDTVFVVVDFDDSSTRSAEFAFGVRFGQDGATTMSGLQALEVLAEDTALTFVDAGGGFITTITYTFAGRTYAKGGDYPPWWSYWESDDYGASYVMSATGAAGHVMMDGDTAGWLNTRVLWPATPPSPNGPRVTPWDRRPAAARRWSLYW
jgi:hypothetical protein